MKRSILSALMLSLLALTTLAQTAKKPAKTLAVGSPEWLVKEYFVDLNPPNLVPYMSIDVRTNFGDTTFGALIPSDVVVTYRRLQSDSALKIYAVTARYGADIRDMYCYIERKGTAWQISAIHWMPAYDEYAGDIKAIKAIPQLNDSLQLELKMKELTISSDSALKVHFMTHRKQFDTLAQITTPYKGLFLLLSRCSDSAFAPEQGRVYEKVCPFMRPASVWAIFHGNADCPAGTFFEVGEQRANVVGFLYVPKGSPVPPMNEGRLYLLDKIVPNWYLYKMY